MLGQHGNKVEVYKEVFRRVEEEEIGTQTDRTLYDSERVPRQKELQDDCLDDMGKLKIHAVMGNA